MSPLRTLRRHARALTHAPHSPPRHAARTRAFPGAAEWVAAGGDGRRAAGSSVRGSAAAPRVAGGWAAGLGGPSAGSELALALAREGARGAAAGMKLVWVLEGRNRGFASSQSNFGAALQGARPPGVAAWRAGGRRPGEGRPSGPPQSEVSPGGGGAPQVWGVWQGPGCREGNVRRAGAGPAGPRLPGRRLAARELFGT